MPRNFRKIEDVTAIVLAADITDATKFNIASGDPLELIGVPVVLVTDATQTQLAKIAPYKGTGYLHGVVKSVTQLQTAYDNIGNVTAITVSIKTVGDQFGSVAGTALAAGDQCGFNAQGQIIKGDTNANCVAIQPAKIGQPAYIIFGVYQQAAPTTTA